MKRIIPHIPNITAAVFVQLAAVVVSVSAFLLTGCSENELPGDENTDTNRTTFTIEVSDGGYAPAAGEKPDTRATENGYATQFTAGDKIGVFAVKNGAIVDGVNNLCFVATAEMDAGGNSSLVWKIEGVDTPNFPASADYYAYYPWQPDGNIKNKVDASKTNVDDFFAGLVNGWTTDTNQGTYTAYTGSDLMIASGTPLGKSLSFSMQHKMALVVIDLPKTKYKLTDANSQALPDYIIDAPDTKFNGFTPCRMSDGTYRYLINPAATENLSGSYTNATSATAEWQFEPSVTAGQYGKYVVDSGTIIEETHQLQAGDFFMKDGTLLSKETTLSDKEKAACIGIVYWVGDPTKPLRGREEPNLQGDKTLANDHSGCTHGLVVSLDEVSCAWQVNYTSVQDWLDSNHQDDFLSVHSGTGASDPLNNIQGYNNTKAIEAFNAANSGNEVNVVQKVVDYRKRVPAPVASSGWYVPSEKELTLLCGKDVDNLWSNNSGGYDNRDLINGKLELISSATPLSSSSRYWSSTERSDGYAFDVDFSSGIVYDGSKYRISFRVRFSFAF